MGGLEMKKKILAMLMVTTMVVSVLLTGCGKGDAKGTGAKVLQRMAKL